VTTGGAGPDLVLGQALGHYRIIAEIDGSKGAAYKAKDPKLHLLVALKFLSQGIVRDGQALSSSLSEHQLMSPARVCLGMVASRHTRWKKEVGFDAKRLK
jgi:hypothetical protein